MSAPSSELALGIDLGGTHVRAAVVDPQGTLISVARLQLQERSPSAVVEAIAQATGLAMQAAPLAQVGRCGVGAAGQIRGESGVVAVAPNLGWREVPFGALLAVRLGRPVRVVNDLSAAAWGEKRAGAAKGAREVLTVFVGSGVGSAIIANDQLVQGVTGVAGELGHLKVIPGGRPCGCGEMGCLEAYAGGHNLQAQMEEAIALGQAPRLLEAVGGDLARLSPAVLEEVALAGDPAALRIYDQAAGMLALAIANQVTVLNPARLVLGGGVLRHCPGLVRRIEDGVAQLSSVTSRQAVSITLAALGDNSGIIGAALLAAG